jgi:nitrous oxide reductase accessory protein NosL
MIAPASRNHRFPTTAAARIPASSSEPWISPRTILLLARKELRDALRNRWFITYTAAFAVLAIALAYLSRVGTAMSGFSGFGATAASLVNLVLLIVPLMGLTIGAAAIAPERERGTLAYLLAQPINRAELFLAKFIGLAATLAGSLTIGFGLSALTLARGSDPRQIRLFLTLAALAALLALAMLAVGMLISVLARRSAAALLFVAGCGQPEDSGPPEIHFGQDTCNACGMIIEDERYAAAIVTTAPTGLVEKHVFDDIGEMLEFTPPANSKTLHRYVRDASTKQWIDADNATLVKLHDLTTPMGSGIAAYADPQSATNATRTHGGSLLPQPLTR